LAQSTYRFQLRPPFQAFEHGLAVQHAELNAWSPKSGSSGSVFSRLAFAQLSTSLSLSNFWEGLIATSGTISPKLKLNALKAIGFS
jgi:hypothetical protein